MVGKMLILSRRKNRLEIQDLDDVFSYQFLYDVSYIRKDEEEVYEIWGEYSYKGIVTNVKEIREEW